MRLADGERARIRRLLEVEALRATRRAPTRYVVFGSVAAAACIVLVVGLLWPGRSGVHEAGPVVLDVAGSAATAFARGGSLGSLADGGRTIALPKAGRIVLAFPGGGTLALVGPGRFHLRENLRAGAPLWQLRVDSGQARIHRQVPGRGGTGLAWETKRAVYTMTGTTAALAVSDKGDRLVVVHGSFRAVTGRGDSGLHELQAGSILIASSAEQTDAKTEVRRDALSAMEAAEWEGLAEEQERAEKGLRTIDPYRSFPDEAELARHYGHLSRVVLQDGRAYRGFLIRGRRSTRVHTIHGVVEVPNALVSSAKAL